MTNYGPRSRNINQFSHYQHAKLRRAYRKRTFTEDIHVDKLYTVKPGTRADCCMEHIEHTLTPESVSQHTFYIPYR